MWLQSSGVLCPLLPAYLTAAAVINGTETGCARRPDRLLADRVYKKEASDGGSTRGIHALSPKNPAYGSVSPARLL